MKNSNIQWIGDIPDDWEVSKFKYVSTIYTGNSIKDEHKSNYESSEDARPYISSKDIDVHTGNVDYNNGLYIKKDDSTFRVARKGCSLMCIEGGSAGKKKALINQDVSFVNKLCCFQSNGKIDERFLYYYLCNPSYEEEFRNNISGMIGGVSVSVLKNFVILVPPLATQTSIATYLDAKCSEIDGLIADINKQIETLNELKKSTITEAVTKGLNKNAKLKDSGIQWIGMIPEGWSVSRVKYLLIERKNYSIYGEEEPLSMSQKYGLIPTSEMENVPHQAATLVGSKIANVGDLVFNKLKAHLGVFSVSKYYGLVSPDYAVYYSNGKSDVKYLEFLFKTQLYISQFKKLITGVGAGLSRLYTSDLFSIYSIYPPLAEQRDIATYLDTKCSEFDSIISDKQKQISTLEAYKKSLIYEYVTGKNVPPVIDN